MSKKRRIKWTTNKLNVIRRHIRNGMTQRQISEAMNISQPSISRVFKKIVENPEGSVFKPIKKQDLEKNKVGVAPVSEKRKPGRPKKYQIPDVKVVPDQSYGDFMISNPPIPSKKRGRPKKVAISEAPTNMAQDIITEERVQKWLAIEDPIQARLDVANNLLQEIAKMSWFQRKDCDKLIKGYFENYGV